MANNMMAQFGMISKLLAHMLNNPTPKERDFVIHMLKTDDSLSPEITEIILGDVNPTQEAPKDDDIRFDYSLNESIKKEFNRFIK
jgi:hypothetical protein